MEIERKRRRERRDDERDKGEGEIERKRRGERDGEMVEEVKRPYTIRYITSLKRS